MHLTDTRRLQNGHEFGVYDVCVVGAGAAGVYVAHRLAQQGQKVLLLEAGGHTVVDGAALGLGPDDNGTPYRGATLGRVFGLGGTTARWSGQLVPHTELDVARVAPHVSSAWRHIVELVARHTPEVRRVLGLELEAPEADACGPFEPLRRQLDPVGLRLVTSEWLPFHRRNLSKLLYAAYPGRGRVDVCLHGVVRSWSFTSSPGGTRVDSLTLRSAGNDFSVRAPRFVLTAGAIESARILLEIEAALPASPFRSQSIGRYLTDHLSCTVASVPAPSRGAIARALAPRFEGGCLRSARILEREPAPDTARGFFHFVFDVDDPGHALVGQAFAALQARRQPELSLAELGHSARGLVGLAWSRLVLSRLHVPADTPVHLQLDVEQVPSPARGVFLSERRDAFERRLAELRWDVSGADLEQARALTERFARRWQAENELPALEFLPPAPGSVSALDAHHPAGICRLGSDGEAVVDAELRVHGTLNLWLLSSGVLPSAGSANPALSMLCLGEELSRKLSSQPA
jgi:choline dehydrogenase-like flavoprotein